MNGPWETAGVELEARANRTTPLCRVGQRVVIRIIAQLDNRLKVERVADVDCVWCDC